MIYLSYSFFLGANSYSGFKSLFNEIYNPTKDDKLIILKGGPGTGKSTIMKKVADAAEELNYTVEINPCSSDPESLDGVSINEKNFKVVDGTAPHIMEPKYPGVCENIINLGECWNNDKLNCLCDEIKEATDINRMYHTKSSLNLKAAALIENEIDSIASGFIDYDKIQRTITRLCKTYINKNSAGELKKRFLSSVTPNGIYVNDSINHFADKTIVINSKIGLASKLIINGIYDYIKENGINAIALISPTSANIDEAEHIIMPHDGISILISNDYHSFNSEFKTINESQFYSPTEYKNNKNKLNFLNKAKKKLIDASIEQLQQAKTTHDLLEEYYINAMDFEKINTITESIIEKII